MTLLPALAPGAQRLKGYSMRMFGFGNASRNDNYKLTDPRPIERYDDAVHCGTVGEDGFAVMAKADPSWPGGRPSVEGTEGGTHRGPDRSFEQ